MPTLAELKAHATHALGGAIATIETDADTTAQNLVNRAGRRLYAMHPWNFRERPPVYLAFTQISIANATWTESTRTLTKVGGFTSFRFYAGVEIDITDGTGATTGRYRVESRTSDDAIVLVESIGSDADGSSDIDGTITPAVCALPSDFGELDRIEITSANSLYTMQMTTPGELARMRSSALVLDTGYHGAILQPGQTAQTSALPARELHVWPNPTAADADAFVLHYRAKWPDLTDDTHIAAIPPECDDLLIELVRLYAKGLEEDDQGSVGDRLMRLKQSPIFTDAVEADGATQSDFGRLANGAIRRAGRYQPWRSVAAPET